MSSKRKATTPRPTLVNAPPSTNGRVSGAPRELTESERVFRRYENLITNLSTLRRDFLQNLLDPRKNVDKECGYPDQVTDPQVYQRLFDREPIANRVVQILPRETWQVQPLVYEDEDPETITPFERAWDDLARQLRGGSMYQDEAGNPVWEYLLRADVLSGIGQFGVVLIGIDDGMRLDQPAEGVTDGREDPDAKKGEKRGDETSDPSRQSITVSRPSDDRAGRATSPWGSFQDTLYSEPTLGPPRSKNASDGPDLDMTESSGAEPETVSNPIVSDEERERDDPSVTPQVEPEGTSAKRRLLFLRVFQESLVQISRWCGDPLSPRFGMPEMYRITLADPSRTSSGLGQPSQTVEVHWSRVLHVADNLTSSETLGVPRMQPVLNRLIDVAKVSGAAGEGYWKQAFATLVLESNPQLAGDVDVDRDELRSQLENLDQGLQKSLVMMGLQAKTLPGQVTDPTPFLNAAIEQICVQLGVPVRVFKGSERGELASSQDDAAWNDRLKARQMYYVTPRIIIPFVDRLIAMGVLPRPKTGKRSMGALSKGKRDLDAEAKPKPGDPSAPPAPGEEGGDEGGGDAGGGKPSFPPFKKAGGPPKLNALPIDSKEDDDEDLEAGPANVDDPFAQEGDDEEPDGEGALGDKETGADEGNPDTPGYSVEWPDIDSMTDLERAQVFNQRVAAWAAYVQGGVDQIIPPEFAMTRLDQFDDEEALAILAEGIKRQEETLAREAEQMAEFGFKPDPRNPGAMIDPEQQEAENEIELAKAENPAGVQQSGPPSPFGAKPGAGGPPGKIPPKPKPTGNAALDVNLLANWEAEYGWRDEATENTFCPTGEGGGVDPSCGKEGGGSSGGGSSLKDQNGVMRFQSYKNFTNVADLTGKGLPPAAVKEAFSRAKVGDKVEWISQKVETQGGKFVAGTVHRAMDKDGTIGVTDQDGNKRKISSKIPTHRITFN